MFDGPGAKDDEPIPLIDAADAGDLGRVTALLEANADVNARWNSKTFTIGDKGMGGSYKEELPFYSYTALASAVRAGRVEVAEALVAAGADPSCGAVWQGRHLKSLLEHVPLGPDGWTPAGRELATVLINARADATGAWMGALREGTDANILTLLLAKEDVSKARDALVEPRALLRDLIDARADVGATVVRYGNLKLTGYARDGELDNVAAFLGAGARVEPSGIVAAAKNAYPLVLRRLLEAARDQERVLDTECMVEAIGVCGEQMAKPFNKGKLERYTQCMHLLDAQEHAPPGKVREILDEMQRETRKQAEAEAEAETRKQAARLENKAKFEAELEKVSIPAELPYGGDMTAAMKAQDRAAIKILMVARQMGKLPAAAAAAPSSSSS